MPGSNPIIITIKSPFFLGKSWVNPIEIPFRIPFRSTSKTVEHRGTSRWFSRSKRPCSGTVPSALSSPSSRAPSAAPRIQASPAPRGHQGKTVGKNVGKTWEKRGKKRGKNEVNCKTLGSLWCFYRFYHVLTMKHLWRWTFWATMSDAEIEKRRNLIFLQSYVEGINNSPSICCTSVQFILKLSSGPACLWVGELLLTIWGIFVGYLSWSL